MVMSSLYRSLDRSKFYPGPKILKLVAATFCKNLRLFFYFPYLLRISYLQIKKGVLESTPPRYQSNENTLITLTNVNPRS